MDKSKLIKKLNEEFNIHRYHDIWYKFANFTKNIEQYIQPEYKEYSGGLLVDFAENIKEILTATFITENLFTFIKENKKKDLLIFTHHPYYQKTLDNSWHDSISKNIDILINNRISIYVCHSALDFHSKYSTAAYLAKELISQTEGRLSYEYKGIEGKVECEYYGSCVDDLFDKITKLSSNVVYYQFSDIEPKKICCSPGGGNMIELIRMAKDKEVDTYIVGVSEFKGKDSITRNKTYFEELQNIGISIIGMGHYETECLAMIGLVKDYFGSFVNSVAYFEDKYYK